MDVLQGFRDFADKEKLFSSGDRLLLAVSGGLDSVVLCELCRLSDTDFVIAHCNFGLRGAESMRDEDFVRRLGKQYNKPVLVRSFDTAVYASEKKVSVQVAARELRYQWFRELIGEGSLPAEDVKVLYAGGALPVRIATAHHRDDNIETLLMNFFKGTGIAGLRGILPVQGRLIRPLLFAGKSDLQQFAAGQNLEWVEDSSNLTDKYTRNYFRHQIIPLIETVYPEAIGNLAENIERFRGIEAIYLGAIAHQKMKLLEQKGKEIHIPVLKLKKAGSLSTLAYEIIKDFGFTPRQVPDLIKLLDSETGKYIRSATHRILKNRNWLIISSYPEEGGEAVTILIESPEDRVHYGEGSLLFRVLKPADVPGQFISGDNQADPAFAYLDAGSIGWPLLLRKWKPGDYFYPLGMRKKKKLGRFFIDRKMAATSKEKVWVLEMNKKIIWVIGLRIDDRFRITPGTEKILQIEAKKDMA